MAIPFPCRFCGYNYMKTIQDESGLCNNCTQAEIRKNPKKGVPMETIDILIKCEKNLYAKIEELCLSENQQISKFMLDCVLEKMSLQTEMVEDDTSGGKIKIRKKAKNETGN